MAKYFWYFYYVSRRTNCDKTTFSCFLVTTGYSASLIWHTEWLSWCNPKEGFVFPAANKIATFWLSNKTY